MLVNYNITPFGFVKYRISLEGLEGLMEIVRKLDSRFRYAVVVRHTSWFQDLAYSFFASNDLCMVWNVLEGLQTPPIVTTDFLYLRFIGDRSIQEKKYQKKMSMSGLPETKWEEKEEEQEPQQGHEQQPVHDS